MDTVTLGRTGVEVSVAGLGCGGHSRLGQTAGATEQHSIDLVRRAIDLGITFIDTARVYGTEEIVGKALAGRRDGVVVSSKALIEGRDGPLGAADLRSSVEKSLGRLQTDCIDVFHLHGVRDEVYDHCVAELVPELLTLRDEGKIRFPAISEAFETDRSHAMLQRAVKDDCWDVMMVGFTLLNPSARASVFPTTLEKNVAVLVMFAVRNALSRPENLRAVVQRLVDEGLIDGAAVDIDDPLGFLSAPVVEAAYRFVRHEPGTHVVLTGTGSVAHLEENVAAINKGPLSDDELEQLSALFGGLDVLSGGETA